MDETIVFKMWFYCIKPKIGVYLLNRNGIWILNWRTAPAATDLLKMYECTQPIHLFTHTLRGKGRDREKVFCFHAFVYNKPKIGMMPMKIFELSVFLCAPYQNGLNVFVCLQSATNNICNKRYHNNRPFPFRINPFLSFCTFSKAERSNKLCQQQQHW